MDNNANSSNTVLNHAKLAWFLCIPLALIAAGAMRARSQHTAAAMLQVATRRQDVEPVSTVLPQRGAPSADITLPSTIQAFTDSPIYARTSGYVGHWYADIGTPVKAGQLLATIQSPEIDRELDQATATMENVQADLDLAEITARRYNSLLNTKAVAQQEIDQNNQHLQGTRAALRAAASNVARLQQLRSFERVIAPSDGIVTQRKTDIGDLVNAGNAGAAFELFRVSRMDIVRVFVSVPEIYSEQVVNGMTVEIQAAPSSHDHLTGRVARSSHSIDSASHTLLTEIDIPNPKSILMPGAYADVRFHLKVGRPPLTIPSAAVLYQANGPQVAVVQGGRSVKLRTVQLGRDFGETIEVINGLTESDAVIADPPDYLIDGMKVSVQNSPSLGK